MFPLYVAWGDIELDAKDREGSVWDRTDVRRSLFGVRSGAFRILRELFRPSVPPLEPPYPLDLVQSITRRANLPGQHGFRVLHLLPEKIQRRNVSP